MTARSYIRTATAFFFEYPDLIKYPVTRKTKYISSVPTHHTSIHRTIKVPKKMSGFSSASLGSNKASAVNISKKGDQIYKAYLTALNTEGFDTFTSI